MKNLLKGVFGGKQRPGEPADAPAASTGPGSSSPKPPPTAAEQPQLPLPPRGVCVGESSSVPEGGRLHTKIAGRFVTVLRLDGELRAIDSICFHAGGPLGIGDIEDLQGRKCIICPWHYYKVDVITGDKYYQAVNFEEGKMVAGEWKSNGVKQRVHAVAEADGKLYVEVDTSGREVDSDEYACNNACGERVINSPASAGKVRLHSTAANVGADGKKPSGHVLQQARQAADGAGDAGSSKLGSLQ